MKLLVGWARGFFLVLALLLIGAAGYWGWSHFALGPTGSAASATDDHDHHAAESEDNSVFLTEKAQANLGLQTTAVKLGEYWESIAVPGSVVEQPGHSHRKVTAPTTGIVKEMYVHPNQLVHPGDLVAELELTGDSLATAQTELLATVRELELNQREIDRVEPLVKSGSLPEKNRLQLEYERQRLQAQQTARIQALQVLGLSVEQIEEIQSTEKLLRQFRILVPGLSSEEKSHLVAGDKDAVPSPLPPQDYSYTVESIDVYPGKRVQVGDEICGLAFHVTLFIEGQAFEQESGLIEKAMVEKWPVTASFEAGAQAPMVHKDLRILLLDNIIDTAARTTRFYIPLQNEVLHDVKGNQGETYRTWRYKPGQKVTLQIPTRQLRDVIVLPAEGVVREGPDAYVFRVNGRRLERQEVQVLASSAQEVALANDGSLFPGEVVASNNAYQLNLALEKARGGGADPHAGHNHAH